MAMFCGDRAVREQPVALDGIADAAAQLVLRDRAGVLAVDAARVPTLGSTSRLIMRSSVDLPEPDVPTMTAIVPAPIDHRHVVDDDAFRRSAW